MSPLDMIEVYCTSDPARIAHAKSVLASERISCVAHGQRHETEESFPVRFLVPPHLVERAKAALTFPC